MNTDLHTKNVVHGSPKERRKGLRDMLKDTSLDATAVLVVGHDMGDVRHGTTGAQGGLLALTIASEVSSLGTAFLLAVALCDALEACTPDERKQVTPALLPILANLGTAATSADVPPDVVRWLEGKAKGEQAATDGN